MQPQTRKPRAKSHINEAQGRKRNISRKDMSHSFSEKRNKRVLSRKEMDKREELERSIPSSLHRSISSILSPIFAKKKIEKRKKHRQIIIFIWMANESTSSSVEVSTEVNLEGRKNGFINILIPNLVFYVLAGRSFLKDFDLVLYMGEGFLDT